MGLKYFLDSNAVIGYFSNDLSNAGTELINNLTPAISVITRIELLSSSKTSDDELIRLQRFIENASVYNLDEQTILKTIELRKQYRLKTPDAIIAATAIINNCILITRNLKDFDKVEALKLINPFDL